MSRLDRRFDELAEMAKQRGLDHHIRVVWGQVEGMEEEGRTFIASAHDTANTVDGLRLGRGDTLEGALNALREELSAMPVLS